MYIGATANEVIPAEKEVLFLSAAPAFIPIFEYSDLELSLPQHIGEKAWTILTKVTLKIGEHWRCGMREIAEIWWPIVRCLISMSWARAACL